MSEALQWANVVNTLFYVHSVLDRDAAADAPRAVAAAAFACNQCSRQFPSSKSLQTHRMKAHGVVTEWSRRIDASGICPVCCSVFHTRLRVLNHVRSSACKAAVEEVPLLSASTLDALRLSDRAARSAARRDGFTAPRAEGASVCMRGLLRPGGRARL